MGFVSYREDLERNISEALANRGLAIKEPLLRELNQHVWDNLVSKLAYDIKNARAEVAHLAEKSAAHAKENIQLRHKLDCAQSKTASDQLRIESLRQELSAKVREVNSLRRDLSDARKSQSSLKSELRLALAENERIQRIEKECVELRRLLMSQQVDRRM